MGVAERQLLQLRMTEMKNQDQLRQQQIDEMNRCTFRPKIIVKRMSAAPASYI